jgi:hypothetical protein
MFFFKVWPLTFQFEDKINNENENQTKEDI